MLLIVDQFEQWLHVKRGEENTELVAALRQCDAEHLQAVVMVRDDFWLAVSRFFDGLEIELLQGQNSALVDLFDLRHARKVLATFGTAYGNVPERTGDISKDQHTFLDQAASELAQGFRIGRPAVSEHLQVLRKAKLIREEPRGRERYYHLDPRPLSEVELWLEAFNKYWKQRMAALDELLNKGRSK